jgi:serine/threonine protein kinase
MAEQREPVVRKVALKIIKLGMDTREVIARFEAERQALALMDHPNIAKVLDGGATERRAALLRDGAGQGRADHEYCDQAKLGTRSGSSCSPRSARRSSTRTRRASSTATSSRATCW